MQMKKTAKFCLTLLLSLVLAVGQFIPSYAFEYEGSSIDGIQVGDKFYHFQYIVSPEGAGPFDEAFGGADPSTIIIDVGGNSAKFSDYIASGLSDFDAFAAVAANQTPAKAGL